jgi:hypothetical protein
MQRTGHCVRIGDNSAAGAAVIIAKWLLTRDLTSVSRRVGLVYSRLRKEEPESSWPLREATGTLLWADDPAGQWTTVPGASAPFYKVTSLAAKKFYRVQL